MEIIEELQMFTELDDLLSLKKEANEILSITVASIKTVRNKL
jgi:hypothetical protein